MYEALHFSSFDATVCFSFLTHQSEHLMMLHNNSTYIHGYHGYKHMLYALNTFHLLTPDGHPKYEKSKDGNIVFYPLKQDLLPVKTDADTHNNMAAALIWHDCGYSHPDDDRQNTLLAKTILSEAYGQQDQADSNEEEGKADKKEETKLDIKLISDYIDKLHFPYNDDEAPSDEVKLLRDCDMSMILYDDYFDTDGLFVRLVRNEFRGLSGKEINYRATSFIRNLQYYTPYLNKVLDNIGEEYLLSRMRNVLIENRS